jgi:4-hydroxy-3-methylbut-2-enyl diphosphate reductase
MLGALGCRVIDATCPKVLRIAGLIKKYSNEGFHVLLAGEADHPEIIGLCGYALYKKITVLSSAREVSNLKTCSEKIVVLSQTTFESEVFEEIADAVLKRFKDATVKNTICSSTINRQREILNFIQSGCDCIIVVGSKFSNNTKSLYNTALANGCHSLIIENPQSLELANTKKYNHIGITSGASTDYRDAYEIYERLIIDANLKKEEGKNEKISGKTDGKNNPKTEEAFCDHRRSLQEKKDREKGKERTEKWIVGE